MKKSIKTLLISNAAPSFIAIASPITAILSQKALAQNDGQEASQFLEALHQANEERTISS